MSQIPTLEQKLAWLKVVPPTPEELAEVAKIKLGSNEIGFQRTNHILDEGMEVSRVLVPQRDGRGRRFARRHHDEGRRSGQRFVRHLPARRDPAHHHQVHHEQHAQRSGIKDGDLWFANDALYGGIHNPDQMVAMPVFYQGEHVAWTVALVHTTETGATEPGGMPVSASARFQEGMNFPPMKIGENFELREDMLNLFHAFGMRAPQMITLDLKARATTADRVRRRLLEVCDREGVGYLKGLFRMMLDRAEQGAAATRVAGWPDGTYRCVTFSDGVGLSQGLTARAT